MTYKVRTEERVLNAVRELTADSGSGDLFVKWVGAKRVADELGIAESTARKHLNYQVGMRRLRKTYFTGGGYGYRPRNYG
jgi:hypothetical protein